MPVDLGFTETCESWQVDSCQFPSKIGGKPAWLSYKNLPKASDLTCGNCGQTLTFLAQIYAPIEEDDANFHRTLFVFICKDLKCCTSNSSKNLRVFRSCLPRGNVFYASEPPSHGEVFNAGKWAKLCNLCGISSDKHCAKCQTVYYCSREHQVLDWKAGHKNECTAGEPSIRANNGLLFPQFQLVIEAEELEEQKSDDTQNVGVVGTLQDLPVEELEEHAAVDKDKTFTKFKKRVSFYPEQVLRYDKGGQPLWIAKEPLPSVVPPCGACGSERQFELQIMPQLLVVLKENVLDWGVIAIYTCKKSCPIGENYVEEFIFKQDILDNM